MTGTLYGIGVGPGDPELLTLKAVRILRQVPVIAYPAPPEGDSMARAIAAPHLPGGQRELALRIPFSPEPRAAETAYDEAASRLIEALETGDVALLCEGDPMFFGSFVYLLARLAGGARVEIVPGISSAMAAAAMLQRPLAIRDDTLLVIPATLAEDEIENRLARTDAAVIMKLGRHLPKVLRVLDRLGLSGNARYIERVGLPQQRIRPVEDAAREGAPYFSIILLNRRSSEWGAWR
jgi:precorrin-2/cobalt-factor-2 C20-methyltransferase